MDQKKRPSGDDTRGTKKLKLISKQPELKEIDLKPLLPKPFVTPAPYVSDTIKCNPFTHGMLSIQFFLCKECRGFLASKSVSPKDDGTFYLSVKMCGACKQLNQQIRTSVKETMKKDWPSAKTLFNSEPPKVQTSGGGWTLFAPPTSNKKIQTVKVSQAPPPTKLTPGQQQTTKTGGGIFGYSNLPPYSPEVQRSLF